MADEALRDELLRFVAARVPAGEPVASDTDLLESELLDSLLIMDVIAHVEAAHGVKLDNADIAPRHFRTVEAIAALVAAKRA